MGFLLNLQRSAFSYLTRNAASPGSNILCPCFCCTLHVWGDISLLPARWRVNCINVSKKGVESRWLLAELVVQGRGSALLSSLLGQLTLHLWQGIELFSCVVRCLSFAGFFSLAVGQMSFRTPRSCLRASWRCKALRSGFSQCSADSRTHVGLKKCLLFAKDFPLTCKKETRIPGLFRAVCFPWCLCQVLSNYGMCVILQFFCEAEIMTIIKYIYISIYKGARHLLVLE